jgi:hypothetical protein
MKRFFKTDDALDFFNIKTTDSDLFGALNIDGNLFSIEQDGILATVRIAEIGYGVYKRVGKIKNTSSEDKVITALSSRFTLWGGECEVYSQYNGWQHESTGEWQSLTTSVAASCDSVRSSLHAAPFMALWNKQTSRGIAFHIIPYCAWEMKISRKHRYGEWADIVFEAGVASENFHYTLKSGEELDIPEIILYEFKNKVDFDCARLHLAMHKEYPRRRFPVVYNSWLCKFDKFNIEDMRCELAVAKRLGIEYFVIDSGWFGQKSSWWSERGDWKERLTHGFEGKMQEFAGEVRAAGLKFGFWLEPESAFSTTEIMTSHPEYFLLNHDGAGFVNFAREDAREYILNTVSSLVDKYGAEFLKFDFNADLKRCIAGDAYIGYFKGYNEFIAALRERHPTLHIENCASGGIRLGLRDGRHFDSFWLSDNQSPYYSHEIFKNTVKRMPPSWLCPYATIKSVKALSPSQKSREEKIDKIIASNDAVWGDVRGVKESFLKASLTGGVLGFSCPLSELSEPTLEYLGNLISEYKESRTFWQNAACHILCDTDTLDIMEYRSEDFSRVEISVIIKRVYQSGVTVYPVLDKDAVYTVNGEGEYLGATLMDDGIDISFDETFTAKFIKILKK